MAGSSGEERAPWVHHFLVRFVALVCRFPRLVLAGALLLAILSLYASQTRLTLRTQRTDLVNPNKDYQQRWRQYLAEFGDEDDVVVVVQGKDHAKMRAALDALAVEIQKQPALFDRLFYKVGGIL